MIRAITHKEVFQEYNKNLEIIEKEICEVLNSALKKGVVNLERELRTNGMDKWLKELRTNLREHFDITGVQVYKENDSEIKIEYASEPTSYGTTHAEYLVKFIDNQIEIVVKEFYKVYPVRLEK